MSDFYSSSGSSSSGGSYIPNYPQAPFLMNVADMASKLGQNAYNWAGQEYGKTSNVTGDTVNQFLDSSNLSKQLAGNQLDRYQNLFEPLENQYVSDAQTYDSEPRTREAMGQAESGVGQAFDAQAKNLERKLKDYGINPSDGRYAGMARESGTERAAAQAGAGTQARQNQEAVGRQMRQNAIGMGQQLPASVVNAMNARSQALSGAENSILANANTGKNLMGLPNDYLGTAMRLGYPPLGNNTSSTSQNGSAGSRSSPSDSGGGRAPSSSGSGYGPNGLSGNFSGQTPTSGGGSAFSPKFIQGPGDMPPGTTGEVWPNSPDHLEDPAWNGDPFSVQTPTPDNVTGGWGTDLGGGGDLSTLGDYGSSNWEAQGRQDPWANDTNPVQAAQYFGGAGTPGLDDNSSPAMTDPWGQSASGQTYDGGSAFDTPVDDNSMYGMYADGGDVPDDQATTGGFVSQHLSPSAGQQTDDIPARLNANEFVIPKDVALWKGQEFFQNLINKSRQARTGASAKPTMQPAAPAQQFDAGGDVSPWTRPRPRPGPINPAPGPGPHGMDFAQGGGVSDWRNVDGQYDTFDANENRMKAFFDNQNAMNDAWGEYARTGAPQQMRYEDAHNVVGQDYAGGADSSQAGFQPMNRSMAPQMTGMSFYRGGNVPQRRRSR